MYTLAFVSRTSMKFEVIIYIMSYSQAKKFNTNSTSRRNNTNSNDANVIAVTTLAS